MGYWRTKCWRWDLNTESCFTETATWLPVLESLPMCSGSSYPTHTHKKHKKRNKKEIKVLLPFWHGLCPMGVVLCARSYQRVSARQVNRVYSFVNEIRKWSTFRDGSLTKSSSGAIHRRQSVCEEALLLRSVWFRVVNDGMRPVLVAQTAQLTPPTQWASFI